MADEPNCHHSRKPLPLDVIEMIKCFIHLIGLTLFLLTACKTSKNLSETKEIRLKDIKLLAWNEDTIHVYHFALTYDNKFAYKIIERDTSEMERNYSGTYTYNTNYDTIFLIYDNSVRPFKATNYLVAISGGYLVQHFENNSKRVFLRIQRVGLNSYR